MSKLWILETLLTISKKSFSKNPFNSNRQKCWVHPVQCTRERERRQTDGPVTPRVSHTEEGEALTARFSPPVSSPAVRSPPVASPWRGELTALA
jgi:hypothetical protein